MEFSTRLYFYIKYLGIEKISNFISYLLPFSVIFLGIVLFFFPQIMLSLTVWFEKKAGATWIPSEKTKQLYKFTGALFLAAGSFVLGWILSR